MATINAEIPYTSNFMVGTMTNKAKIEEGLLYAGAIDQVDLLIDLELLLEEAGLTEKQMQVVELYFYNQYTQEEVSKVLNVSQQAVLDHIKKVKQKINKVLERWKTCDEKFNNR